MYDCNTATISQSLPQPGGMTHLLTIKPVKAQQRRNVLNHWWFLHHPPGRC